MVAKRTALNQMIKSNEAFDEAERNTIIHILFMKVLFHLPAVERDVNAKGFPFVARKYVTRGISRGPYQTKIDEKEKRKVPIK